MMRLFSELGIVVLCLTNISIGAVQNCVLTNAPSDDLTSDQKNCIRHALKQLPIAFRVQLYEELQIHRNVFTQRPEWRNGGAVDLRRSIRNKRTLDFLLRSLSGLGIRSALIGSLMPSSPAIRATTPKPTRPSLLPQNPATVPPSQIDSNTIRYPFRPSQEIPFLAFAPLPPGVTVPYPTLLQWPTTQPPVSTSNQPCPCTAQLPASTQPTLLKMPMNTSGKPHLPVSGGTYDGLPPSNHSDFPMSPQEHYGEDENSYLNSFDHDSFDSDELKEGSNGSHNSDDYFISYQKEFDDDKNYSSDIEEADYLRNRDNFGRSSKSRRRIPQKYISGTKPFGLLYKPFTSASEKNTTLLSQAPTRLRIIVPPLPPRKRRDIFFDDAFKSFNLSSFDFHKIDPTEYPESTQSQFLEIRDDKLVPSLDYQKKLERDLEKYVESYVEQQISQGEIDTSKPKRTIVQLKTNKGPTIKTVTTTLSKLIDGDKTLIESILDYSKSISPVPNPGELVGESSLEPSFTHLTNNQSIVSKAFENDRFDTFSWNLSR